MGYNYFKTTARIIIVMIISVLMICWNDNTIKATEENSALCYDVNGDTDANTEDINYLKKALLCEEECTASCDVNKDGIVNFFDLTFLKRMIVVNVDSNSYESFATLKGNNDGTNVANVSEIKADLDTQIKRIDELEEAVSNIEKNINVVDNPTLKTIADANLNNHAIRSDGKIIYTHSGTGNNWWYIPIKLTDVTSNFILVDFTLDSLEGKIKPYLQAKDKSGKIQYLSLGAISEAGNHQVIADLNYYVVYYNIDLNADAYILFANCGDDCSAVYSKADLKDRITNVTGTLGSIVSDLNTKIESKNVSFDKNNRVSLFDANGNEYTIQIANGNMVLVPVIPQKVLYIGNSLLLGFKDFGMAASDVNNDYYHYVNSYIESKGTNLTAQKLSGTEYENCISEEQQTKWINNTLASNIDESLDLVIIQIGDNINTIEKKAVFENGADKLVKYIRTNAPKSRIAWVGEWYSTPEKQEIIKTVCQKYGIIFVDISDLPSVSDNKAKIGDSITYNDGRVETISNSGIASHPSSQGMKKIANRIIEKVF